MKKVVLVIAFLSIGITMNAQGVKFFKGSFGEALTKAEQENKLVFVDFYTVWCGPCKMMDKDIFPLPEVGAYFNEKFVAIKIDAEKGEGIALAEEYKVPGYPTMVYLNPDRTEKGRLVGAADTGAFFINYSKQAIGEGVSFTELFKAYEKGDRDLDYIAEVLTKGPVYAQSVKDDKEQSNWYNRFSEISKWYFAAKQPKNMLNAQDFALIKQYYNGGFNTTPVVEFVYNNYEKFKKVVLPGDVSRFVQSTNNQSIHAASGKADTSFREYVEAINGRLANAYQDGKKYFPEESKGDSYKIMKSVGEASYAKATNNYDAYLDWNDKYRAYSATYRDLDENDYLTAVNNLMYRINHNKDKDVKKTLTKTQSKRCIKVLKESIKNFPESASTAYSLLGDIYSLEKNNKEAIKAYTKVKELVIGTRGEDYFTKQVNEKIEKLK
ncbi:thioredoxin family protein [Maribacter sp. 2304DJ31-5]|uniref:thioredoxin family protein n=1 Tax=Maribacter sp. 2304DJ31-5 TaxID=3386273 RepID=UPI0039BCFEF1